jgi:hypothetical protein
MVNVRLDDGECVVVGNDVELSDEEPDPEMVLHDVFVKLGDNDTEPTSEKDGDKVNKCVSVVVGVHVYEIWPDFVVDDENVRELEADCVMTDVAVEEREDDFDDDIDCDALILWEVLTCNDREGVMVGEGETEDDIDKVCDIDSSTLDEPVWDTDDEIDLVVFIVREWVTDADLDSEVEVLKLVREGE